MKIRYRCTPCGVDSELDVRDRNEGEDLKSYMTDIAGVVGAVHRLEKPGCEYGKVDLLLPVTPEGKIGGYRVPEFIDDAKPIE
jgi:hypothetical protein